MISQCAIYALYDTKNEEAIALAKSFERRRCGHKDRAIEPSKCMESIVNIKGKNKHRYVVVSQDVELRRKLRKVAGVPLVYMNRSVMVLEPLSDASSLAQKEFENSKLRQGLNDIDSGKNVPEHSEEVKENAKKRKGPKEPNPLSIKRKQAKSDTPAEAPKRKRKRKSKGTEEVSGEGDAEENQQQQEQKSNNETDTE